MHNSDEAHASLSLYVLPPKQIALVPIPLHVHKIEVVAMNHKDIELMSLLLSEFRSKKVSAIRKL